MQVSLKSYLASITFTGSNTINPRYFIRKHLESHPFSNHRQSLGTQLRLNQWQDFGPHLTISNSFMNAFDISNITSVSIEASVISYLLWRKYHCYLRIKDLTPNARSLCKYTWKVVVYIVLTGKRHLGPDFWPETPQQAENTKSIMRIT